MSTHNRAGHWLPRHHRVTRAPDSGSHRVDGVEGMGGRRNRDSISALAGGALTEEVHLNPTRQQEVQETKTGRTKNSPHPFQLQIPAVLALELLQSYGLPGTPARKWQGRWSCTRHEQGRESAEKGKNTRQKA